jgi:two-component system, LytTR family, sensor kinase
MITLNAMRQERTLALPSLGFDIVHTLALMTIVYINLLVLLPRYLVTKKIHIYLPLLLLMITINAHLVMEVHEYFMSISPDYWHPKHPPSNRFYIGFAMVQIFMVGMTSLFHFLKENFQLKEEALAFQEIQSHQLKAELESLKAQINPHFLFNTLNNIYSFSLFKSDKSPEMILKLSELMHYIIYDCKDEEVLLEKELEFIQNYIDLEEVRVGETLDIQIDIQKPIIPYFISPLIFIPFLENAFKHGNSVAEKDAFIRVELGIDTLDMLTFRCINLYSANPANERNKTSHGIGLENIRKRLQLVYPQKHDLKIKEENGVFNVELKLDLSERIVPN